MCRGGPRVVPMRVPALTRRPTEKRAGTRAPTRAFGRPRGNLQDPPLREECRTRIVGARHASPLHGARRTERIGGGSGSRARGVICSQGYRGEVFLTPITLKISSLARSDRG